MEWILLIGIGGFVGVSDIKIERMPETQCKEFVRQLVPARRSVAAVCVGPDGQSFSTDDAIIEEE